MSKIKLLGIDPSLRNVGLAEASYDLEAGTLCMTNLLLHQTQNETRKVVRQNSDDLRCARQSYLQIETWARDVAFAMAEIPTGTQSARGSISNGIMIGVLAALTVPLIQVLPHEVKIAAVGHKDAAKEEMIEWAMGVYPALPWLMTKRKGKLVPVAKNEHLADAVATVHAGIQTEEFKRAVSLLKRAGGVSLAAA